MRKQIQTKRNPENCNFIATSPKTPATESHSPPPDSTPRKERPKGFARSQLGYWKKALRVAPNGNFFVQIFHDGRRGKFTFERNAEVAAEKARLIFLCIQKEGWDSAVAKYSPGAATRLQHKAEEARVNALDGRIEHPTIGDLIRVAEEYSTVRPGSFYGYAKCLRYIVAESFSVPHLEEVPVPGVKRTARRKARRARVLIKDLRHDYRTGGLKKWQAMIDAVKLADLTPEIVQAWRKAFLTKAGADPILRDHAAVNFNKSIRNAKALFGKKLMPLLEKRMILTRPLPFDGICMEKEPPMRYRSMIDPAEILRAAASDLEPEPYKALILCLVLGLRRSEADTLLWRQVDFDKREVSVEPTEFYLLKSRDSARVLCLDEGSLALFRGWRARAHGAFVLESPLMPRPLARNPGAGRCKATFDALSAWLKTKGVTARKPIHELRKEAGTILLKQGQPIESVSRYLGHSTIGITLAHYADLNKRRATVDMAALMPAAAPVAEFPKQTHHQTTTNQERKNTR